MRRTGLQFALDSVLLDLHSVGGVLAHEGDAHAVTLLNFDLGGSDLTVSNSDTKLAQAIGRGSPRCSNRFPSAALALLSHHISHQAGSPGQKYRHGGTCQERSTKTSHSMDSLPCLNENGPPACPSYRSLSNRHDQGAKAIRSKYKASGRSSKPKPAPGADLRRSTVT